MRRNFPRRAFLKAAATLAAGAVLPAGLMTRAGAAKGFVTRAGTGLVLDGQPWYLYGGSSYGTLNPGAQGTIAGTVQLAVDAGLNTVRLVNFFDERGLSDDAPYDPVQWAGVDAMLDALRRAGLKAILDLSAYRNHLHNRALSAGSTITPYSQDWRPFIRFVARRVNTVTGFQYKQDRTIAVVSFAGEPNPPNSGEPLKPTTGELTNFYATAFAEWRKHDKNHLLSSGGLLHIDWEELYNNPNGSGIDWQAIASLPNHDVPSIHNYWASFPPTASNDFKTPKFATYCGQIGKPWITEEFGFKQAPVDYSTIPPTVYSESDRGAWFQVAYDIQMARNAAGAAFWNLGGEVHPDSHDVNPNTPATWATVQVNAPALSDRQYRLLSPPRAMLRRGGTRV